MSGKSIRKALLTARMVAERPQTLALQRQALRQGRKAAVLYPHGSKEGELPAGHRRVQVREGVVHHDPRRIRALDIVKASREDRLGEVLGLGPHNKADIAGRMAAGEPQVNVVARKGGEEAAASAATPSTAHEQAGAIRASAPEGSKIGLEHPAVTLAKRVGKQGGGQTGPQFGFTPAANGQAPEPVLPDWRQTVGPAPMKQIHAPGSFEHSRNLARHMAGSATPPLLWHGTFGDYDEFARTHGNLLGDHGKGYYFTNTPEEARANYANLTSAEMRAKIRDHIERHVTAYPAAPGTDQHVKEVLQAYKDLGIKHSGIVMPAHVAIRRPFVIGGPDETQFNERAPLDRMIGSLRHVAGQHNNADNPHLENRLKDIQTEGRMIGLSAAEMKDQAENYAFHRAWDRDSGKGMASELFRLALEHAGYDGVIDHTVRDRFRAMPGVNPKTTTHYVAFHPEQIKSAHNEGTFDPSTAKFFKAGGGSAGKGEGDEPVWQDSGDAPEWSEKLHADTRPWHFGLNPLQRMRAKTAMRSGMSTEDAIRHALGVAEQVRKGRWAGGRAGFGTGGTPDDPGTPVKGPVMQQAFRDFTGREHGASEHDLPLIGRGDMTLPPGMKPEHFAREAHRLAQDVRQWNDPQRRFWYENSGDMISQAVGHDPEMADKLTMGIAKTSPQTPVLDNAAYAAMAHHQMAAGEPVKAGRFPNAMGPMIQKAYEENQPGAVGPKIGGYQSGFRTRWRKNVKNLGANDIHNMRWLGWKGWNKAATTGHHNYDRMMRSAVAHILNAEKFDHERGEWNPGQVQAVGWAKSRHEGGVPAEVAGYDLTHAMRDRTARLTYESAPGHTSGHFPEYHDAPLELKQRFHDDINKALTDEHGRDLISHGMGLLTLPTEHGVGVYQGHISPGSAARVVTGAAPGGWKGGVDSATRKLMSAAELVRAHLLKQDAAAWHFPNFPKNGLTWNTRNLFDVRLGRQIDHEEAKAITRAVHKETGTDFHSPMFTKEGYRFLNVPEASGISNKDFKDHLERALSQAHENENPDVIMGYGDSFYHDDDWSKDNGQGYLQGLDALGPHVSGRAKQLLSALGPRIAEVEARYAKEHGWTPRQERLTPPEKVARKKRAYGGAVERRFHDPRSPRAPPHLDPAVRRALHMISAPLR